MGIEKLIHRRAESYVSALQNNYDDTPSSGEKTTGVIIMRLPLETKSRWVCAAQRRGTSLSAWIREVCELEVQKVKEWGK